MAKTKKNDTAQQGNILNSLEAKKKFKQSLSTLTHYFQQQDDIREGLRDSIADIASEYGVEKKMVRKMAKTMYKHEYGSVLEENRQFETLYESVVEGKFVDDANDPVVDAE